MNDLRFSYEPDDGPAPRAGLGLIVLKTDETMEPELRALLPEDGVALYHTRIESAPEVTAETLAKMADKMVEAASLLPETANLKVIAYGCTSGATVIGEDRVEQLVKSVHPDAMVTNPLTALKAKLDDLGARRIALLTPYVPEVTDALREALNDAGFEVVATGSFSEKREEAVTRIPPQTTLSAIEDLAGTCDCDAVFASCTNLRTVPILAEAERRTGKPVISSNSALSWHIMRLAGLS
ncbi:MAG: Asp/Glu racemase [Pseudomonadota bacterium]